jgi:hypothetical protein
MKSQKFYFQNDELSVNSLYEYVGTYKYVLQQHEVSNNFLFHHHYNSFT